MKKTILIGIAGGCASGKTSISAQLKEHYEDTNSVVIIRQDDYYNDQSEKTMEERVKTNYDHPFAFDNELLVAQLQRLLQRQPICKPTYDFVHHTEVRSLRKSNRVMLSLLKDCLYWRMKICVICAISRSLWIPMRISALSADCCGM